MKDELTQDTVNNFLDALRESGTINMYGAGEYIQDEYKINKYDANRFLVKWMETFDNRVNHGDVQNVD